MCCTIIPRRLCFLSSPSFLLLHCLKHNNPFLCHFQYLSSLPVCLIHRWRASAPQCPLTRLMVVRCSSARTLSLPRLSLPSLQRWTFVFLKATLETLWVKTVPLHCFLFITSCYLLMQSEHALPEQFKTVWNGKQFVTECTDVWPQILEYSYLWFGKKKPTELSEWVQ